MSVIFYVSEMMKAGQDQSDLAISVYLPDDCGKLQLMQRYVTGCVTNVSCVDTERGILYCTGEQTDAAKRRKSGDRILMLALDKQTGLISGKLGEAATLSPNPVYVALDKERRYLLCANHALHTMVYKVEKGADGRWHSRGVYDDSTVLLYSLDENGLLKQVEDAAIQDGSGPLRTQTHAHPHCTVFSPDGELIAVCDKGADKVFMYGIDRENNRLVPKAEPYSATAGDEPRFCAFHPTLPLLYMNHEGNTTLDVLHYKADGALTHVQTIEADPKPGHHTPGEVYEHQGIAMHPQGKALYSVIRGVNALAVYSVDKDSGKLTVSQLMSMGGDWPRCCEISPDGKWVIAGTRQGGEIFLYRVLKNGLLEEADRISHETGVHYIRPVVL